MLLTIYLLKTMFPRESGVDVTIKFCQKQSFAVQACSQGGGRGQGGVLPPARLKQVQFALNRKPFWCYALFGVMP